MPKRAYLRAENQGFFVEIGARGDFNGIGGQDDAETGGISPPKLISGARER